MKTTLLSEKKSAIRVSAILIMLIAGLFLSGTSGQAQIYEPEGLNMPGAWNAWTNPPTNLVLASSTQVVGGKVVKIATGTPRWQTSFSVAATGGDLTGGSYEWLFTSGSSSNYYANKWSAVTIIFDSLQMYTKEGASNNSITLVNGKWYTMNFEDIGYTNTRAIFMETSAAPIGISTVTVPATVVGGEPATINVILTGVKSPEENIFIRFSTDAWATSAVVPINFTGTAGSAEIPGQAAGTVVSYYAFSTTLSAVASDFDLVTLKLNNNSGTNYSYTVSAPPPVITFANLQWPEQGGIDIFTDFYVYGQAYIAGLTGLPTPAPGLQAWVGYSSANTDPSTWIDWIAAAYNAPAGNNDEFKANLGPAINAYGRFYYVTRFQLNANPYKYGGFSATGGGFWDGVTNKSGILDVYTGIPEVQGSTAMVYPNPTFGGLIIELPVPSTLRFTNTLGSVILEKEMPSGRQMTDISGFKAGVYHLQIITGNQTAHHTVIKR